MANRVIIIGAGIAGISAAYYLNKAGLDITVLEKDDGHDNCSYGNAGMIVPSHIIPLASPGIINKGLKWMLNAESPFYIRPRLNMDLISWGWKFKKAATRQHVEEAAPVLRDLLMASRQLLIDLEEDEGIDFGFQRNGLFMLCNTRKGLEEEAEIVKKANTLGIPAKILSAKEVRQMEPSIEMDILGAAYFPNDSHLHPGLLMDQLKTLLKARGVQFFFDAEVTEFNIDGSQVTEVITKDGNTFSAREVIVCTGASAPCLAQKLQTSLPIQAGKGYSITLSDPKKLPNICAILAEAKVTMTPMSGALRFAGTMEITGTEKSVTPSKINGLKKSVCRYFPEYSMENLKDRDIWVGLRPCSPDGLPYVGKLGHLTNVYASAGHAMMGMSLGPVSGKIISQLISTGKSEHFHNLIDPNRYT